MTFVDEYLQHQYQRGRSVLATIDNQVVLPTVIWDVCSLFCIIYHPNHIVKPVGDKHGGVIFGNRCGLDIGMKGENNHAGHIRGPGWQRQTAR
jgi:hypothetical protein